MKIRSNKVIIILLLLVLGCKSSGNASAPAPVNYATAGANINAISCKNSPAGGDINLINPAIGINVLPVTLAGSYANAPMVSVKICEPGTSNCLMIDNILVDTGSFGLRVFKSALAGLTFPQVSSPNSQPLAECAQFGIGSTWGPIQTADVILGGESAVTIPIQMIDATFATRPSGCLDSDTDPNSAGYNGILGVGLFKEDCGSSCVSANPAPDLYYSCNGLICTASNAPLASQVVNPVVRLTTDNNGVNLELPAIAKCGVETVSGALTLGIGTRANNGAISTSTFAANAYGEFTTSFNGHSYTQSFIDSGTNVFLFPRTSSAPSCTNPLQGSDISSFNCPFDTINFIGIQISGATQRSISFNISNAYNLFLSPNFNFNDLSANLNSGFDWGLPFFYGRKVFVGIEGKTSSLGTGPYWAY